MAYASCICDLLVTSFARETARVNAFLPVHELCAIVKEVSRDIKEFFHGSARKESQRRSFTHL